MPRSRHRQRDRHEQTRLAGTILWLPPKDPDAIPTSLPAECHDHPVVILSPRSVENNVVVLLLTSLGGKDLEEKYPTNPARRRQYLPIHPASLHPDLNVLLCVDGGLVLRKKSYVSLTTQFTIPISVLRPYQSSRRPLRYALKASSYQALVKFVKFTAPLESPSLHMDPAPVPAEPRPISMSLRGADSAPLPALATASPPLPAERQPLLVGFERQHNVTQRYGTISNVQHAPAFSAFAAARATPTRSGFTSVNRLPLPTPHRYRRGGDEDGISRLFSVALRIVVAGCFWFGLWKAWEFRAELLALLGRSIWWLALHVFRLAGTLVKVTLRALGWFATQALRAAKGLFYWIVERIRG